MISSLPNDSMDEDEELRQDTQPPEIRCVTQSALYKVLTQNQWEALSNFYFVK